ncbi:MAG TPA: aminotransferase class I/II-fold pyridoxal phosphate-dependent enzyme [Acidimicrobiales bacterium]|nr:aminotransferase class I/II-fold pyridoxal phosphate-dependent enzyme [Acidimicrobiales bacterium]
MISEHGGNARAVAQALGLDPDDVLDLSASLNPVAPDPTRIVARHLDALSRYPDPTRATAALADAMDVEVDRLLLTNGGAEAIALVAADVHAGWADECDFALYRRYLPVLDPTGARFRSNPHNPTGRLADAEQRADVWDEAFYPLATGRWTRGDADAVVIGSLTKLLACPGLRVGYVLADAATIERLRQRQPQWSANGLVCAALPDLLDTVDLLVSARAVATLRAQLLALLTDHGLDPLPSDANYVVCNDVYAELVKHGIVVRDCTAFGLPDRVRIAVPDEHGLARLAEALS